MKKISVCLLALMTAGGAFAQSSAVTPDVGVLSPTVTIGGRSSPATLNQISSFLANQLAHNRNLKNVSDSRIAVASFVDMNNLEETSKLGMALAENMMHEMHVRGFGVVDFKTRENLHVKQSGDFVFSRNLSELRKQYNIHYFLSGTVNRSPDGAVINARLVQADSGLVVSTAQGFVNYRDLQRILGEASSARAERIVVERPTIPALPQNTVSLY